MVSTRGGTRTSGVDEADAGASTMLRKKPVRKATATAKAPASTKSNTTTSKPKTTRSKKADPEPEQINDDTHDELQDEAPAPAKTARKTATRAKKDDEPAKPSTSRSAATKAPAKTAKSTTARATRGKVAGNEVDEEKPAPTRPELKPTTQSRATRATRATAAKEKATPLSPKKITQVSKAPARSTKTTVAKIAPSKSAGVKPTTRGRPAGRRRNVSDENADIPTLPPPAEEMDSEVEVAPRKKLVKAVKGTAERAPSPISIPDDSLNSTRPSTPDESPHQSINYSQDYVTNTPEHASEAEDEDYSEQSSQDELAGPKSPMKRLSPREAKKYASAQKHALPDLDVPMRTPVRRFAVLGTQQGTPQTQKPYCKPSVPMYGAEPMTVARGQSRAMVFQPLQPLPQPHEDNMDVDVSEDDSAHPNDTTPAPSHQHNDLDMDDQRDAHVDHNLDHDPDLSLLVDPEYRTGAVEDELMLESFEQQTNASENDLLVPAEQEYMVATDRPDQVMETEDPDETIVTNDEMEEDTTTREDDSFGSVNSVIVNRQIVDSMVAEEEDDSVTTPQPETLIWENIREDVTIPFNFNGDVSPSRSLPQSNPESPERSDHPLPRASGSHIPQQGNAPGFEDSRHESTMRLSDYVDMASLAEVKQAEAGAENTAVEPATVEEAEDDESMVEGEVTMFCAEPPTPRTIKRSPVKLTTAEDVDEEDDLPMDGDVTLLLKHDDGPISARHSPVRLTTVEHVDDEDIAVDGEMSLLLEQPDAASSVELSPIKLSTAEDYPEDDHAVVGDLTMVIEDHLPPSPELPDTPVLVNNARASDVTSIDLQEAAESEAPHFALPTIASRRKSISSTQLPELGSLGTAWFDQVQSPVRQTNQRSRPGTASGSRSSSRATRSAAGTPNPITARLSFGPRPRPSIGSSARSATKERMPGLPSAASYEELLGSPTGKTDGQQDRTASNLATKEHHDPSAPSTHGDIGVESEVQTPSATNSVPTQGVHVTRSRTPQQEPVQATALSTPQPEERFPGLPAKRSYEEHAKTAMPATRFVTPERRSARRPATAQKPASLRKLALTGNGARTPMKTPLKAPAETPAQIPMTPHPKAPLKGVVALVDVYTSDGGCATAPFSQLLQRLGAKTTKTFSDRVTHIVFKDGHPKLLQTLIIHNKQVAENGSAAEVFCVNSRWVNDCDANGMRMPEADEEYAVDIEDAPRTAKRRRKSMEPMSLLNNGGNIVRDRKSSLGRVSIGRLSSKTFDMPSDDVQKTPEVDVADKENSEDSEAGSSPTTPQYLSAPDKLVQQTAPINRVRKLDLKTKDPRRLTFTNIEF